MNFPKYFIITFLCGAFHGLKWLLQALKEMSVEKSIEFYKLVLEADKLQ